MAPQRIDARFLLPRPPSAVTVLGGLDAWRPALLDVGVATAGPDTVADLAVAPADAADAALAAGTDMIILEGKGGSRRLQGSGRAQRRILARPTLERPDFLIALDCPRAAVYAIEQWAAAYSRRKRLRNRIAQALVRHGVFPDIPSSLTIAATSPGLPFVLAAARDLAVPADSEWFLTTGSRDLLSRNVFHVLPPGSNAPELVVKFARVPGYEDAFARDEHGLALASASTVASRHAPALVGRFEVGGLHASVETAAVGPRLRAVLTGPGELEGKLAIIESVASWLLELARETVSSPAELEPERRRILEDIVSPWVLRGADPTIVDAIGDVPAVLQHADVDSENVIVGDVRFTVLDWEYARRPGLPLADIVYFLTDALLALDEEGGLPAALRLLRGESPRSSVLFRWIRTTAETLRLSDEAVGAVVTLVWLDNGRGRLAEQGFGHSLWADLATVWLEEPDLGPTWSRWRDA